MRTPIGFRALRNTVAERSEAGRTVVDQSDQAGEPGAARDTGVVHEVEVFAGAEPLDQVAKGNAVRVTDETWQQTVRTWIGSAVGEPIGGLDLVRTEAWSTVWRCTSSQGVLWFKENSSTNPAEGAIHQVLAGLAPEYVTPPVAWDRSRGWILTRNGGTTLMDRKPETRGVEPPEVSDLVRDYAQLQLVTIDHRSALLDAGLPEASPAGVGLMLTDLAEEMAEADPQDPRHIDEVEFQRLRDAVAGLQQAARDLLEGSVPLAFDHNDLFPRNVFVPEVTGAYRFFDFGESLWAHPFGSLVMLQWELAHQLKIDLGDTGTLDLRHPPITGVFDAYLEQWREYADLLTLRRLTAAALQIAPLHRAWVWMGVLRNTPTALAAHGKTPRAWIFDVERPVKL